MEEEKIEQHEEAPERNMEIEAEARTMGWSDKTDWRGNPDDWRSAEEFVERGREILPIVLKNKNELLKKNQILEDQLKEMKTTMEEFKEYRKADKDRAYKQALTELKEKKKEAIEEADGDLVVKIDDAIDELREAHTEPVKVATKEEPALHPEFISWMDENPWYRTDVALQHASNAAGVEVQLENPSLQGKAFFDAVTAKVKERYPEKFGGGRRSAPSAVESGQGQPRSGSKKQTYENLPADAKAACDKFVKQGLMTKEEYVKDFEWN